MAVGGDIGAVLGGGVGLDDRDDGMETVIDGSGDDGE